MNPRKQFTDWGGTIQKFATATLAVSAIVGAIVWAVVGPRVARIENLLMLGIRDRLDLIAAVEMTSPVDRRLRLDALKQKLDMESRMLEEGEMNALIIVASMVVAAVGQWANSQPRIPTPAVKIGLAALGLAFYGLGHGWPAGSREAILVWLDNGWVWALALPGAASLIGLAPGWETKR